MLTYQTSIFPVSLVVGILYLSKTELIELKKEVYAHRTRV